MFTLGMPTLIALLQFLFSLAGYSLGATNFNDHIAQGGHDVLSSNARVQDGIARFECQASASGWCHYTLYPAHCGLTQNCTRPPLQRFTVARGDSRQIVGLSDFRLCVGIDAAALGPDCQPIQTRTKQP